MNSINNIERIRQQLTTGKLAIGTGITFSDSAVSELSAEAGYDFTWIDTEHAPFDLDALGVRLTELNKQQAEYLGVDVAGPYKPDHYRY